MKRRGWAFTLVAVASLFGSGAWAETARPRKVTGRGDEVLAFVRAVLGRDDAVASGGGFAAPAREGEGAVSYAVGGSGAWELLDGSVVQCAAFEDEEARRRRDAELAAQRKVRPELTPYGGTFFGMRRVSSDGQSRAVRIDVPPQGVFAELGGLGQPVHTREHGWVVVLQHSAMLFEPGVTRRLILESSFSLESLALVAQREVTDQRYTPETGVVEQYEAGKLVRRQAVAVDDRDFLAVAWVVDERGKPAQNVRVQFEWEESHRRNMVSGYEKDRSALFDTDRNGYVEQVITRAQFCYVSLYKSGYLPGRYEIVATSPRKTMRLVPLPVGTVSAKDLLAYGGEKVFPVGELAKIKAVGFSLDVVPGRWGGDPGVAGWTLKKEDADLWFEIVDPAFDEKLEAYSRADEKTRGELWRQGMGFVMKVEALRGTEFAAAPEQGEEGLWEDFQYREAPLGGYVREMTGLAAEKPWSPKWFPRGGELPSRLFVHKGGRYGKILDIQFLIKLEVPEIPGKSWQERGLLKSLKWSVGTESNLMQARDLGNRLLLDTDYASRVPAWTKSQPQ